MNKPELVLSNTCTFFSGRIENIFRKAKKYGFKHLEIVSYRWTTPAQILALSKKYQIEVAGIHLPNWWDKTLTQSWREAGPLISKIFSLIFNFYIGPAIKNPGLSLAAAISPKPYLLFHSPLVMDMKGQFDEIAGKFHTVIESIPYQEGPKEFLWNPIAIRNELKRRKLSTGLVFDQGHLDSTKKIKPELDMLEIYRQTQPEIIHISYNSYGIIHLLPDKKEREELKQMLKIHTPRYIVIETYPLVSIKKGKKMMEKIIDEAME